MRTEKKQHFITVIGQGGFTYKVVVGPYEREFIEARLTHCIECKIRLRNVFYQGSDILRELVCPVCGLVHAVFGAYFYLIIQSEIVEKLLEKRSERKHGFGVKNNWLSLF